MREVLPELMTWWRDGKTIGVGTVVGTWRSAPRPAGASMLVGPDQSVVGSVSGGCVEGAVYDLAQQIVADDMEAGRPVAVATVVEHPDPAWLGRRLIVRPDGDGIPLEGALGSERAQAAIADDVRGLLANGRTELLTYGPDGQRRGEGMRVFCAAYAPKPRMLVFGAIDFAAAVARLGSFLGYHVTVCDARPVFATVSRFPFADEVVVDWPHRYLSEQIAAGAIDARTVMCVLLSLIHISEPTRQAEISYAVFC